MKLVSMVGTGFFYVTKKNVKNNTKKLLLKKYDPVVRQHVLFKVHKILLNPDHPDNFCRRKN